MRRISAIIVLLVLVALFPAQAKTFISAQVETCPDIVRTALESTSNLCQEIGRNQICYGHVTLDAQPQPDVTRFTFAQEGDVADINDLQSIRLSVMDTISGAWGISLMRLQANLPDSTPDKNVTLLLFGDVELNTLTDSTSETKVTVKADHSIGVRQSPTSDAKVIAWIASGQVVTVDGRLADSSWVHVSLPDGTGWVIGRQFTESDLQNLRVVNTAAEYYGPMQAFYFTSGHDDSMCSEAPDSGLLIQTPEGVASVSLLINEVDIQLGSTVFFQAEPGEDMIVRVVEGSALVRAFDTAFEAAAGTQISIPLDENLEPSGPPTSPTAYDMADVQALPLSLLERKIAIHVPVETATDEATPPPGDSATDVVSTQDGPDEPDNTVLPPTAVPPTLALPTIALPTAVLPTIVPPTAVPPTPEPPPTDPPPVEPPPTDPPTAEQKIVICHKGNTIEISLSAWPDHEAHGDTIGACPG